MPVVLVVNGPNLNLLGTRRPEVYGSITLTQLEERCSRWAGELGWEARAFQSNQEGVLVDRLHAARGEVDGVIINPGALTHYSYTLHDAIEAIEIPTVEVHITNIKEREEWRRRSVVAPACVASIYGRGVDGYRWAIRHLAHRAAWPFSTLPYGPLPDQVGDLRLPEAGRSHPVTVLLHGGFWRHMWTRDQMDGLAIDLARRGLASWNLEYRRVGAGGGWPSTLTDVAAGVRYLAQIEGLDPPRLALVGHSAGGHLALWAATRGGELRPRLSVGLAAITDLETAHLEGLAGDAVGDFLGAGPPPWQEVSPLHMLPARTALLLAHGTADPFVPVQYSRRFALAAQAAGDAVEYLETEGSDHFSYLDPASPAWIEVAERIAALLK